MRDPNFLIIGTMKGGTTALYDFVCEHPDVVPATEKEIHYYSLYPYKGRDWYLEHFPERDDGVICGEASPTYFDIATSLVIPRTIRSTLPDAKLILIVRDPVIRAVSHFMHLCTVNKVQSVRDAGLEGFFGRDFGTAFSMGAELDFHLSQVLSFSFYHRKFLNFRSTFPAEQLLVLRNEWLLERPRETMEKVFNHLGLPPIYSDKFERLKYSAGTHQVAIPPAIRAKLERNYADDYGNFLKASGTGSPSEVAYGRTALAQPLQAQAPAESVEETVRQGEDGWIFLTGGRNSPLDYFKGRRTLSPALIDSWERVLRERAQRCADLGARFVQLFVPDKLTIYADKFPSRLDAAQGPLGVLMRGLHAADAELCEQHLINPTAFLTKNREKYPVYWKTDSHWGFPGCHLTYQLLFSQLGLVQHPELRARPRLSKSMVMDLGCKLDPPVQEMVTYYRLVKDARRVHANEVVEFKEKNKLLNEPGLHVGSNVVYRNDNAPNPQRVVLFGTSFSEYREHLLTGMLAESVRELHFVWSTSLDFDYIEKVKPDLVIAEIAERFIPACPSNTWNLETYAESALAKYRPASTSASTTTTTEVAPEAQAKPEAESSGVAKDADVVTGSAVEQPEVNAAERAPEPDTEAKTETGSAAQQLFDATAAGESILALDAEEEAGPHIEAEGGQPLEPSASDASSPVVANGARQRR